MTKQNLMSQIRLIARLYMNGLTELLLPYNYTPRQWGLLRLLVEEGDMTLSQVASIWQIEKPTLTPVVQNLIERELITIQAGSDKRQKIMVITEQGKAEYFNIHKIVSPYIEELFQDIDEDEIASLEKGLNQINNNMERRG